MIYKEKKFLITILIIGIFQVLLYLNNNQKTSFRYFVWNIQGIKIGKLINISFFSGFLISTILIGTKEKKDLNKNKEDEVFDETFIDDEMNNSEIPPQRDVRDPQPTISVNYRVIKDNREKIVDYDNNSLTNDQYQDDWNKNKSDW